MWTYPQKISDLFAFTKEILNRKFHFLYSVSNSTQKFLSSHWFGKNIQRFKTKSKYWYLILGKNFFKEEKTLELIVIHSKITFSEISSKDLNGFW